MGSYAMLMTTTADARCAFAPAESSMLAIRSVVNLENLRGLPNLPRGNAAPPMSAMNESIWCNVFIFSPWKFGVSITQKNSASSHQRLGVQVT